MKIYVDGQNTPYHSVICIIGENSKKYMKVIEKNKSILKIEKIALIKGIEKALKETYKKYIIISDSTNAIRWYYLSEDAKKIREKIKKSGKKIFICWLPREINLAGLKLEERLKKVNGSMRNILKR